MLCSALLFVVFFLYENMDDILNYDPDSNNSNNICCY